MSKIVVNLLKNWSFEVIGEHVVARVWNNDSDEGRSWIVLKKSLEGVSWDRLSEHHSLDGALNAAVYEVFGSDRYEVHLPDGMKFKRPGSKAAEEVMASAGWYFMSELIGFVMLARPFKETEFEVRGKFEELVADKNIRLGEVNIADEDAKKRHWVADLVVNFNGWMHLSDVDVVAKEEFLSQGLSVLPFFDYRPRTNIAPKKAIILQFPKDRIVRAA